MPEDAGTAHKEQSYTELERRLGKRRKSQERRARESLAAQGSLYSGARQAREREVQQDIDESWHQGAQSIEDRSESARQAQLGRDWGTSERQDTQGWQSTERIGSQDWQGQMQTQAETAQRSLASDKAYYQSYLQDQIQAGRLTEQQAAQEFQAYSMQADQQFEYSQMMSQQGYGYGMQNLQGEWDAYGQTLGFQNQAGLMGMQQGFDWQMSQSDQYFRQGLAEYGWEIEQVQNEWRIQLQKLGAKAAENLAEANQPGFWENVIAAIDAVVPG